MLFSFELNFLFLAQAKQSATAASFNCTGAVRKAGFLSVKKWLLRKKHQVRSALLPICTSHCTVETIAKHGPSFTFTIAVA
jgi:hypothetical protein